MVNNGHDQVKSCFRPDQHKLTNHGSGNKHQIGYLYKERSICRKRFALIMLNISQTSQRIHVASFGFASQIIHPCTILLKHPLSHGTHRWRALDSSLWPIVSTLSFCLRMPKNDQYQKGDNGAAENVEDGTLGHVGGSVNWYHHSEEQSGSCWD